MNTSLPRPKIYVVDLSKVTYYLLSPVSKDGKSKEKFFSAWGFSIGDPTALAEALVSHAGTADLEKTESTRWGTKFVFEGPMSSPRGRTPAIRSVWEVRAGETHGRLVTAYPF